MVIKSQLIHVDLKKIEERKIEDIIRSLQEGGIIVFPTDTFYGLGANCYLKEAVLRIYGLKRRKPSKPLGLVVSEMRMAESLAADLPPLFKQLASEFWPGPLTLILKASPSLPRELLSRRGTVGLRVPALPWLQILIKKAGFPLTATSANLSGEAEVSNPEEVMRIFKGKVDLIVDGGPTPGGKPSTVVDLSIEKPKIIREGALPSSLLAEYLPKN